MRDADDAPVVRLTNLLLLDMAKRRFDCMRVRTEGQPAIERFESGAWRAIDGVPSVPFEQVVNRLRLMADIEQYPTCMVGGSLRLLGDGLTDFDVSFSRTDRAAVIVVIRIETRFGFHTNSDLARRAFGLVAQANGASTREEVRARAREAAEVLPETDGQWAALLFSAASACASAGVYDDASALFERARGRAEDARLRVDIEQTVGRMYEENGRIDEAITRYRAAVAAAETMPAPHVHAIVPLASVGEALVQLGDLVEADADVARAEAIAWSTFGEKSAVAVPPRTARVVLERQRDATLAEAIATDGLRAAKTFEMAYDEDRLHYELADLAMSRGDAKTATTHLRTLLEAESLSPNRAHVYVLLARALRAQGSDAEALSALRSASALVAGSLAVTHPLCIEVERELAQLTTSAPYR